MAGAGSGAGPRSKLGPRGSAKPMVRYRLSRWPCGVALNGLSGGARDHRLGLPEVGRVTCSTICSHPLEPMQYYATRMLLSMEARHMRSARSSQATLDVLCPRDLSLPTSTLPIGVRPSELRLYSGRQTSPGDGIYYPGRYISTPMQSANLITGLFPPNLGGNRPVVQPGGDGPSHIRRCSRRYW